MERKNFAMDLNGSCANSHSTQLRHRSDGDVGGLWQGASVEERPERVCKQQSAKQLYCVAIVSRSQTKRVRVFRMLNPTLTCIALRLEDV
jgi:hypothetical protein